MKNAGGDVQKLKGNVSNGQAYRTGKGGRSREGQEAILELV
jgi:hypothetical protein